MIFWRTMGYFINENQLEQWVEAAENIKEGFGIDKALGYLIGEKFYGLIQDFQHSNQMIRTIDNDRKKPEYTPVRTTYIGEHKHVINVEEEYEYYRNRISMLQDILTKFAGLIKESFGPIKIREYFLSNPRLGALGHICSEEDHNFFIENGAVEHSIDTEVEDALTFGEMMKYFGLSL